MFKGRKNKLLELERKIRPYRHVFIRIIRPIGGPISYEYANGINEFDTNLVVSLEGSSGQYLLTLNNNLFKNLENVIQETDVIYSAAENLIVISSNFNNAEKSIIQINVFDFITGVTADVDGEIILIIKEFYE